MKEIYLILDKLSFLSIDEFFTKKAYIKEEYNKLSFEMKEIYKWYFYYQLCVIKNPLKELCWEYINCEYEGTIEELNKEYIEFCNKRDRLI